MVQGRSGSFAVGRSFVSPPRAPEVEKQHRREQLVVVRGAGRGRRRRRRRPAGRARREACRSTPGLVAVPDDTSKWGGAPPSRGASARRWSAAAERVGRPGEGGAEDPERPAVLEVRVFVGEHARAASKASRRTPHAGVSPTSHTATARWVSGPTVGPVEDDPGLRAPAGVRALRRVVGPPRQPAPVADVRHLRPRASAARRDPVAQRLVDALEHRVEVLGQSGLERIRNERHHVQEALARGLQPRVGRFAVERRVLLEQVASPRAGVGRGGAAASLSVRPRP